MQLNLPVCNCPTGLRDHPSIPALALETCCSALHSMPGRPKSKALKAHELRRLHDQLMKQAVALYRGNGTRPKAEHLSLRKVCTEISTGHQKATGQWVDLDKTTLSRLAADPSYRTLSDFNAQKGWLTAEENEKVVDLAIELAHRGFPLNHGRLKEIVDDFLRKRLGPTFPGVGNNWTDRFVLRNRDRLGTYWSRSLDTKRSRAVNPHTHKAWFDLLEATFRENDIQPDCIYGSDEVGFTTSLGQKERVIGAKGKSVQHQVRGGSRENITAIPTICADGTSIAPLVIFKGKAFQVKWLQNNPLNAS